MKTIHKYIIPFTEQWTQVKLNLPYGYKILHVNKQEEQICIWCEVDDEARKTEVKFNAIMTGDTFNDMGRYIGTVHLLNGNFVVHIYVE